MDASELRHVDLQSNEGCRVRDRFELDDRSPLENLAPATSFDDGRIVYHTPREQPGLELEFYVSIYADGGDPEALSPTYYVAIERSILQFEPAFEPTDVSPFETPEETGTKKRVLIEREGGEPVVLNDETVVAELDEAAHALLMEAANGELELRVV
jgi:hypothetical protein